MCVRACLRVRKWVAGGAKRSKIGSSQNCFSFEKIWKFVFAKAKVIFRFRINSAKSCPFLQPCFEKIKLSRAENCHL